MPTAIDFLEVGLIFAIWCALALGAAYFIGRVLFGRSDFEADHPGRERLGYMDAYRAERDARIRRAMARHENAPATSHRPGA